MNMKKFWMFHTVKHNLSITKNRIVTPLKDSLSKNPIILRQWEKLKNKSKKQGIMNKR